MGERDTEPEAKGLPTTKEQPAELTSPSSFNVLKTSPLSVFHIQMYLSVDPDAQQKDMLQGLCKGNDCQMLRKMLLIVSSTEPETSFVELFHPKNAIDSTCPSCPDTDYQFPAFEHRTILSVFCSCPSSLSLLLFKEESTPLLMIRGNIIQRVSMQLRSSICYLCGLSYLKEIAETQ